MKRIGAVLMCALALVACGRASPPAPAPSPHGDGLPAIAGDVAAQRGTLVESHPLQMSHPLNATGARGYAVVYRTVSGVDGGAREVSGTVFVPAGTPPANGWPIITYGHGTTGITTECGPSAYPDLLGYDLVVASLLQLGFVVTMSDYEGLGHPGRNLYLEPKTEAVDLIDAVRAARQVAPEASTRWYAAGVSQGGQAAWAANEFASLYGDGLEFAGSASLSPATDLSGFASLAASDWLSRSQQLMLPMLITGLVPTHPDLRPDDYLHGPLGQRLDMWLSCLGPDTAARTEASAALTNKDTEPNSPAAATRLEKALVDVAVPRRPASGPMLVITGDADDTVREAWVQKSVRAACALGDKVQYVVRPHEGHNDLNGGPQFGAWLLDRQAGKPVTNTC